MAKRLKLQQVWTMSSSVASRRQWETGFPLGVSLMANGCATTEMIRTLWQGTSCEPPTAKMLKRYSTLLSPLAAAQFCFTNDHPDTKDSTLETIALSGDWMPAVPRLH